MIYLDYQATTPLAPEARAAMAPFLDEAFGNPHSPHRMGREAAAAVEAAREHILSTLLSGVPDVPREAGRILFTGGATEALNWAIKGSYARTAASGRRRIVTTAIEHAAVLDTVRWLETQGAELVILPVDEGGFVDAAQAAGAVDAGTALVVAMHVNNEIGTIQEEGLRAMAGRARAVGAPVICDAVQSYGRLPVPVAACDLVAISAHKIHGPKGIGALWVREGQEPQPLIHGGGQEGGLRSGTLSPALCAGFGAAARLALERREADLAHVRRLHEAALGRFRQRGWRLNGPVEGRYPGNMNLRREGLDVARLMADVRDVAFSAGSACASGSGRPSHVLRAIGLSDAEARSSIRLGFGRYTREDELIEAAAALCDAAERQEKWL